MPAPRRQPAFQFYAAAWLGSVQVETMPPEVEGTYIRLLARQWIAEILPSDPAELRLLTKLTPAQWKKAWPRLEPLFPLTEDQRGRQNETLAAVHQEREEYLAEAAQAGRAGAQKRWGKTAEQEATPTQKKKGGPSKNDRVSIGYPTDTPTPSLPDTPAGTPSTPQWGLDDSGSVSVSVSELPTPAVAVVGSARGAPTHETATTTATADTRKAAMLAKFVNPLHREAAEGYVRSAQHPDTVVAHLEGVMSGLSAPGMRPIEPNMLGQALHDMRVAGVVRLTPNALASFVKGVGRDERGHDDQPPAAASPDEPLVTGESRMFLAMAKREAAAGNPEFVAWCTERNVPFQQPHSGPQELIA